LLRTLAASALSRITAECVLSVLIDTHMLKAAHESAVCAGLPC
jgi:hypothetical protein